MKFQHYGPPVAQHPSGQFTALHDTSEEIPQRLAEAEISEPTGDAGTRVIRLCEPVSPVVSYRVILELLQYETESPGTPVHLFICSPGGCVVSGLAIIDVMRHVTSPVFTYAIGFAASMSAVILAAGAREHRYVLPHSRVMIHQASGAAGGTLENLRATLAFQSELETELEDLLACFTGHTVEEIRAASRVDNWMKAPAAVSFGLADHVLAACL